jgi:hypothetical protein
MIMQLATKLALGVVGLSMLFGYISHARGEENMCRGKRTLPDCNCYDGRLFYPSSAKSFFCWTRPVDGGDFYVITTHWRGNFRGWYNVLGIRVTEKGEWLHFKPEKVEEHPRSDSSVLSNRFVPPLALFSGEGKSLSLVPVSGDLSEIQHRLWNEDGTACVYLTIHKVNVLGVALFSLGTSLWTDILPQLLIEDLQTRYYGKPEKDGKPERLFGMIWNVLGSVAAAHFAGTTKQALVAEVTAKLALEEALSGYPREQRIIISGFVAGFIGALVEEIFRIYERDPSADPVNGGVIRHPYCQPHYRHSQRPVRTGG